MLFVTSAETCSFQIHGTLFHCAVFAQPVIALEKKKKKLNQTKPRKPSKLRVNFPNILVIVYLEPQYH